jgi:hypothetical protein
MPHYKGRIVEILLEGYQNAAAILACPAEAVPKPGQYLQTHDPDNPIEVLPTSLFAGGELARDSASKIRLPVAGPIPQSWQPGTDLLLRGPLGHGFSLPRQARRIALVAFDHNPGKLLPLIPVANQQNAEITLLHNGSINGLPTSVEEQPLEELTKVIDWADYLAVEITIERIEDLQSLLSRKIPVALPAEVLVSTPMPCGGLAKCGVCVLQAKRSQKLTCEDGPVFKLRDLF